MTLFLAPAVKYGGTAILGGLAGMGLLDFLSGDSKEKGAEYHQPYEHYSPVYAPAQSYGIVMPQTQYMIDSYGVQTMKADAKAESTAEPHVSREEGMPTEIPYLKIIAVAGVAYVASSYLGKKKR